MTEQSIDPVGGVVPAEPAETPHATPDDASDPPTLATQIAQTDAALRAWRDESVRRREAWEAEQAEVRRVQNAWRKRMLVRSAIAGAAGGVVGLGLAVVGFMSSPAPRTVEVATPVVEAAPVVVEAAPPVVEAPPVAEAPVEVVVAAPSKAAVAVVAGSASTWTDPGHHWVKFEVNERELVQIAWRDAADAPVLEPMRCGPPNGEGVRVCLAGRSLARINHALEQGAAPGLWTVEACGPAGCTDATTFAVP